MYSADFSKRSQLCHYTFTQWTADIDTWESVGGKIKRVGCWQEILKKNDNEAVTALTFSEHSHKLDTWAEFKMAIKFKIEVTVVFLVLYPFSTYE